MDTLNRRHRFFTEFDEVTLTKTPEENTQRIIDRLSEQDEISWVIYIHGNLDKIKITDELVVSMCKKIGIKRTFATLKSEKFSIALNSLDGFPLAEVAMMLPYLMTNDRITYEIEQLNNLSIHLLNSGYNDVVVAMGECGLDLDSIVPTKMQIGDVVYENASLKFYLVSSFNPEIHSYGPKINDFVNDFNGSKVIANGEEKTLTTSLPQNTE